MSGETGRRRPLMTVGLVVLALILIGTAFTLGRWSITNAAEGSDQLPRVSDCGTKPPIERPARLIVTCADAGEVLTDLHWASWSDSMATGSAQLLVNDCLPSCARGSTQAFPAEVILDRPVRTDVGPPAFTRLVIVFPGQVPAGSHAVQVQPLTLYPAE